MTKYLKITMINNQIFEGNYTLPYAEEEHYLENIIMLRYIIINNVAVNTKNIASIEVL